MLYYHITATFENTLPTEELKPLSVQSTHGFHFPKLSPNALTSIRLGVQRPTAFHLTSCRFSFAILSTSACSLARSASLAFAAASNFLSSSSFSLLAASSKAFASAKARSFSYGKRSE